tara:strand:- start:13900 stop:14769 length:870 start_codon:yes stop_codon:yes gene_type:complete
MRSVLVTGVSSGIGKAIAEELLNNDFFVIGSVRKKEDAKYFEDNYSKNFKKVMFDVTKKKEIETAKKEVEKILSENKSYLCSIVNNSGIALGGPVRYLDVDIFRKQFEVNFFGLIEVTKCFLDLLIENNKYEMKNKIINIGSISGKRAYPFVAPYTSSKHALEGFSDALRRELLIHNLDVVLIQPGPIKSAIWEKAPSIEDNPFLKTEYEIPLRKFFKGYIQMGMNGLNPQIIGQRVVKILMTNKPKTRYVITPQKIKNYLMPGFLPDRWVDKLTGKMLGLIKKKALDN